MSEIVIDTHFPGGNVVVQKIAGDHVLLHPDLRTTSTWWFYWHFRIRGAAGRRIRFTLGPENAIGVEGPCFSPDGQTWRYLGSSSVEERSFTFDFPPDLHEAFFAVAIPYLQSHLHRFLAGHPQVEASTLGISEHGRPIEMLSLLSRRGLYTVPLTARTHACESIANYALEGMMEAWLADTPAGAFLRENVDFRIVPFIDKDGVEEGDQGKNRAPHDHNRDSADLHYAATRAFQAHLPRWRGHIPLALDLHCPWIRGGRNEEIFLVGCPAPWETAQQEFAALLAESQQGELRYDPRHTIPAGVEWNSGDSPTLVWQIRKQFPVHFACTIEIPYARAGGQLMSEDRARQFGRDLSGAIALFLPHHPAPRPGQGCDGRDPEGGSPPA